MHDDHEIEQNDADFHGVKVETDHALAMKTLDLLTFGPRWTDSACAFPDSSLQTRAAVVHLGKRDHVAFTRPSISSREHPSPASNSHLHARPRAADRCAWRAPPSSATGGRGHGWSFRRCASREGPRGVQVRIVEQVQGLAIGANGRPIASSLAASASWACRLVISLIRGMSQARSFTRWPLVLSLASVRALQVEVTAEHLPLRVGDHADEEAPAARGLEDVVDAPGGGASPTSAAAPRRWLELRHVLGDEVGGALEERARHLHAAPGGSRSRSAARMPTAAKVPPMMSTTEEPARSGRSGRQSCRQARPSSASLRRARAGARTGPCRKPLSEQ